MALLITAGQSTGFRPISPSNGTKFTLEELQKLVDGNIELIQLGGNMIMFCNDEGKIRHLQLNVLATMLLTSEVVVDIPVLSSSLLVEKSYDMAGMVVSMHLHDVICGNAVLMHTWESN